MNATPHFKATATAAALAITGRKRKEPPANSADSDTAAAPPADAQPTNAAASATSISQPSTAALAIRNQAPPMLRCLAACRDVQFVLMQMLTLEDLAPLNAACRRWREWLLNPPLVDGLKFFCESTFMQIGIFLKALCN